MAANHLTPTLLQRLHNETEDHKWQINDITTGASDIMASSQFDGVTSRTFISICIIKGKTIQQIQQHSINKSMKDRFTQCLCFLEDKKAFVVSFGKNLQFYEVNRGILYNSITLENGSSCICTEDKDIFVSIMYACTVKVYDIKGRLQRDFPLSNLQQGDYPSDMTVVENTLYLCSTLSGHAFSYCLSSSDTSKVTSFKNGVTRSSRANSITVHKEKKLVFILWDNVNICIYSDTSSDNIHCTEISYSNKLRITDGNIMFSINQYKDEILIYDVETIIDLAMLKKQLLSTTTEKNQRELFHQEDETLDNIPPSPPIRRKTMVGTIPLLGRAETTNTTDSRLRARRKLAVMIEDIFLKYEQIISNLKSQKEETDNGTQETDELKSTIEELEKSKIEDMRLIESQVNQIKDLQQISSASEAKLQNLTSKHIKLQENLQKEKETFQRQQLKTEDANNMFVLLQTDLNEVKKSIVDLREASETQMLRTADAQNNLKELSDFIMKQISSEIESVMSPQLSDLKTLSGNLESLGSEFAQMIQNYQPQSEPRKESVYKTALQSAQKHKLDKKAESKFNRSETLTSVDSGRGSETGPDHAYAIEEAHRKHQTLENARSKKFNLEASKTITKEGGTLEIIGTDISLDVPQDALSEDCQIHLVLINRTLESDHEVTFSSNSAVIVELSPNNLQFNTAVKLTLPHCLKLKPGNQKHSVKILTSHHVQGVPHWEVEKDAHFELRDDTCIVFLKKFCWVTYKVDNEVVEGKKLQIFTAGKPLVETDCEGTVEVGYYLDLPGKGNKYLNDTNKIVHQRQPFLFRKDEKKPLTIFFQKLTPSKWHNEITLGYQNITFESIESSEEKSCAYHIRTKSSAGKSGLPFCQFRVYQHLESINMSYRFQFMKESTSDEDEGEPTHYDTYL
ncbi:uncharacterized protein [Apostichopus japonicus]|uniref:uncharacterized protein isoform X2 n=1 Tax=Stichopus japonicus TaxID=307972 RepID=UPI003AB6E888